MLVLTSKSPFAILLAASLSRVKGSERRFDRIIVIMLIPTINVMPIPIIFSSNSKNGIFSKFKNKIVVIMIEIKDVDKTNTNNFFFKLKNLNLDNAIDFFYP
jgi:hypothetical protein